MKNLKIGRTIVISSLVRSDLHKVIGSFVFHHQHLFIKNYGLEELPDFSLLPDLIDHPNKFPGVHRFNKFIETLSERGKDELASLIRNKYYREIASFNLTAADSVRIGKIVLDNLYKNAEDFNQVAKEPSVLKGAIHKGDLVMFATQYEKKLCEIGTVISVTSWDTGYVGGKDYEVKYGSRKIVIPQGDHDGGEILVKLVKMPNKEIANFNKKPYKEKFKIIEKLDKVG